MDVAEEKWLIFRLFNVYWTDLHDPKQYAGVCLHRKVSEFERPQGITLRASADGLFGYGFIFSAEQWLEFYRRYWFYYEPWMGGDCWDWAVGHMVEKLGLTVARPCLSRSRHIGMIGTNWVPKADQHSIAEEKWQRFSIED